MYAFISRVGTPSRWVWLPTGVHWIGRDSACRIRLEHGDILERQARVEIAPGGSYSIVDLGGRDGMRVNGRRVCWAGPLGEDDVLHVARHQIRVLRSRSYFDRPDEHCADDRLAVWAVREPSSASGGEPSRASPDRSLRAAAERMHQQLIAQLDLRRQDVAQMSDEALRMLGRRILEPLVAAEAARSGLAGEELLKVVLDEALGLGPLESFLADDSVSEVMVNGPSVIFVESGGRLRRSAASFSGEQALRGIVERIVSPLGRRVDESSPMVDARLPDGSRVNVIIPPLAVHGTALTIRRFGRRRLTAQDLLTGQTLDAAMLEFLTVCVRHRRNIIVSGGTGSGKTTLLNVLSALIPGEERVITIEDSAELAFEHPNLVALETRPRNIEGRGEVTIRDLVRNALRMRPDRIVVGECRGGETLDMLQAMNTGHDGSLSTVHANSPRELLSRLEVMVLMSGVELPVTAIREQIASSIHVIVHQARYPCGTRRITRITEVAGMVSGTIQTQDLFRFVTEASAASSSSGRFVAQGNVPQFYEELARSGAVLDLTPFREALA